MLDPQSTLSASASVLYVWSSSLDPVLLKTTLTFLPHATCGRAAGLIEAAKNYHMTPDLVKTPLRRWKTAVVLKCHHNTASKSKRTEFINIDFDTALIHFCSCLRRRLVLQSSSEFAANTWCTLCHTSSG